MIATSQPAVPAAPTESKSITCTSSSTPSAERHERQQLADVPPARDGGVAGAQRQTAQNAA